MNQLSMFETSAPPQYDNMPAPPRVESEGERLKRIGMDRATWGKERQLGHAREIGHDIATGVLPRADGLHSAKGICTADDIAAQWDRENYEAQCAAELEGVEPQLVPWLGNAAGQIFQDGNWEWTGNLVKSARPHAHANLLREWKRKVQG